MLVAENISYSIGNKQLLDGVSLALSPGKLNLIIGPNGAGKSTLVKVLSGQLAPQTGTVRYGDKDLAMISVAERARYRSVLSQNTDLAFPLKVQEVVMMGRYPHFTGTPGQKDAEACSLAMALFDISDFADRDYMTLSGGEKQRVHFARVMAQIWYPSAVGCRYLFLDEPLTFLDVRYQFEFMRIIKKQLEAPDLVVVGVVHDLNLTAKFADQVTLIHQGRILADGSRNEVLTKENIETAYQLVPVIRTEGGSMYLFFE
jgi:iron complex transport system ATP-binding protein